MGESYEFNEDFSEVTVKIRQGVEWSDGTPFTANDVAFSLNLLLANPDLNYAGEIVSTVASAEAIDDLNVRITLTGPNPRFVFDKLTFHADLGVPLVAAHVWEGQDPATFTNYDPEQGWPLCTGPYELVYTDVQRKIWDLREDWWGPKPASMICPRWSAWSSCPAWTRTPCSS
jgi:peptide/nickel transport system substrate-binding protein